MGAGASGPVNHVLKTEALRTQDAGDITTEGALEEVKRLRKIISYFAEMEERNRTRTARNFKRYKLSHVEDISGDAFRGILFAEKNFRDFYYKIPFKETNLDGNGCECKVLRFTFSPPLKLKPIVERRLGQDCSSLIWEFLAFNLDVLHLAWPYKGRVRLTGIIIPEVGTFVEKVYKSSNRAFTSRVMTANDIENCFYNKQQLRARRKELKTRVASATSQQEKERLLLSHKRTSGLCDGACWLKRIPDGPEKATLQRHFINTISKHNVRYQLMEMWGGFHFHGGFHRDDGCLGGDGLVALGGGRVKRVDEIVPGDIVCSGRYMTETAVVTCVTRQRGDFEMSKIQTTTPKSPPFFITPVHPIRLDNEKWVFPKNVSDEPVVEVTNTIVYNFVLNKTANKKAPSIWVNNVECITLGHLLKDPVVQHKVYGGNAIRRYLESLPEYPVIDLPWDGFSDLVKQMQIDVVGAC